MRTSSYYVHKIKVGVEHTYKTFWGNLKIKPENKKTYIVRDEEDLSNFVYEHSFAVKLVLDNSKLSRLTLYTMKRKVEAL